MNNKFNLEQQKKLYNFSHHITISVTNSERLFKVTQPTVNFCRKKGVITKQKQKTHNSCINNCFRCKFLITMNCNISRTSKLAHAWTMNMELKHPKSVSNGWSQYIISQVYQSVYCNRICLFNYSEHQIVWIRCTWA